MSGARDLHSLTRLEGIDVVAAAIGVSPRSLVNMRRGETPITVDELHALGERWPDFDLAATVKRLGLIREVHGKSKRARAAIELAGTQAPCATCPKPRPCDGCPALRDAIDGRR